MKNPSSNFYTAYRAAAIGPSKKASAVRGPCDASYIAFPIVTRFLILPVMHCKNLSKNDTIRDSL